jgi:hypothetical protein
LIVAPEEVDSYECVHILNYFNFPFNLEEDNVLKPLVKKEMGFSAEDGYPCLMIESSKEEIPNLDLSGTEVILGELRQKGFIGDHKQHSAREKQTYQDFIMAEAAPLLDCLLIGLKARL